MVLCALLAVVSSIVGQAEEEAALQRIGSVSPPFSVDKPCIPPSAPIPLLSLSNDVPQQPLKALTQPQARRHLLSDFDLVSTVDFMNHTDDLSGPVPITDPIVFHSDEGRSTNQMHEETVIEQASMPALPQSYLSSSQCTLPAVDQANAFSSAPAKSIIPVAQSSPKVILHAPCPESPLATWAPVKPICSLQPPLPYVHLCIRVLHFCVYKKVMMFFCMSHFICRELCYEFSGTRNTLLRTHRFSCFKIQLA